MSESYFSNEQFQQLKADNQKLAEENLRLRTELEGSPLEQKRKKRCGQRHWLAGGRNFSGQKI
jgi:hypothetical protein